MEEVQCAECGTRYDSQTQPFCPRCGNEGARPLRSPVVGFDRGRRRAQMGGLILAVLGLVTMLQLAWVAVFTDPLDDEQLEGLSQVPLLQRQAGGALMLRFVVDGEPVDAHVVFLSMDGQELSNVTTADGWANTTVDHAFGRIEAQAPSGNVSLSYYAPEGTRHAATIDVADPPQWVGERPVAATRIMSGMLAAFAAFVMVAGMLAFRLRAWRLGVAGAVLAAVPALVMLLAAPVAGLLLVLPAGTALWFIVGGRRHFQ